MAMVELIDRVALIKAINADKRGKTIHAMRAGKALLCLQIICENLHLAPTVDAVEVVRCKDCFAWKEHALEGFPVGKGYCKVNMMDTDGYFYCGYAERRTDGNL